MDSKILIAYASKCGSTGEVAQAIGQSLCEKGVAADVRPVKSVTSLDGYRAVVIGSAIRFGQWLPEAVEFVKNNQARLSQIPTAFFTGHMLAVDDSEDSRKRRQAYTDPVRKILTPKAEVFFAGKIDFARLSFLERLIRRIVSNAGVSPVDTWWTV